jgi:hypothetical protein
MHNLGDRAQRLIHGVAVWEQARYVRIKHNHIRAFGIPTGILSANPTGKVIMVPHFVVFTNLLRHTSSAQGGLLFGH